MNSKASPALETLEADLPTTEADSRRLAELRRRRPANPFDELEALLRALPPEARRQSHATSEGWPEFEL